MYHMHCLDPMCYQMDPHPPKLLSTSLLSLGATNIIFWVYSVVNDHIRFRCMRILRPTSTWNWSYGICISFLNSYSRGYSDGNFLKNFTAVDTEMAWHGYSDGLAWIQRWTGVDTEMAKCGYRDGQVWIQRRLGVDIATAQTSNEIQNIVALATQIRGRLYCDEIVSTGKKTLRRGNIHAFLWILPRFFVA